MSKLLMGRNNDYWQIIALWSLILCIVLPVGSLNMRTEGDNTEMTSPECCLSFAIQSQAGDRLMIKLYCIINYNTKSGVPNLAIQ